MFSKRNLIVLLAALSAVSLLAGCGEDAKSPTAVFDTAPPVTPANLRACTFEDVVQLVWQENTIDGDLAGYRVWRSVSAQSQLLVSTPQIAAEYWDQQPRLGQWNTYIVAAVDANGNQSAYAQVRIYVGDGGYTPISVDPGDESYVGGWDPDPTGPRDDRTHY